jgi:hypothetical protein
VTTPRLLGPWLLLLGGGIAATLLVLDEHVRTGGYVLAGSLGLCALLRMVLPTRLAGAIAVRSRATDVLLLGSSALAVAVLAFSLNLAPA